MKNLNTIRELLKRPIAYQPVIAKAFDSVTLAILWCQFYYWSDKTTDPDGWIYKTRTDVFNETGLSRKQQETARKKGTQLGVLECKRMGLNGVMHYQIDEDKALELIEKYAEKNGNYDKTKKLSHVEQKLSPSLALPGWINVDAWMLWEQHRKEIKKTLTPLSRKQQIAMLEKNQSDHVEIINTSIQNGWTGLFPLSKFNNKGKANVLPATPGKYAKFNK